MSHLWLCQRVAYRPALSRLNEYLVRFWEQSNNRGEKEVSQRNVRPRDRALGQHLSDLHSVLEQLQRNPITWNEVLHFL